MNKRIKNKWVKALRSGDYKQGKGSLRDCEGNFCCLGVLCDLHAKATKQKWESDNYQNAIYLNAFATLPFEVRDWAGISDGNPTLTDGEKYRTAAQWNDNGRTFQEIASQIEKEL